MEIEVDVSPAASATQRLRVARPSTMVEKRVPTPMARRMRGKRKMVLNKSAAQRYRMGSTEVQRRRMTKGLRDDFDFI
jgi:hypothetical protein